MTDVCCVMCGRLDRMHRVCVLRSVEQWRSGLLASSESREGGMCVVIVMNMNGPNKRETEDLKQSLAARYAREAMNRQTRNRGPLSKVHLRPWLAGRVSCMAEAAAPLRAVASAFELPLAHSMPSASGAETAAARRCASPRYESASSPRTRSPRSQQTASPRRASARGASPDLPLSIKHCRVIGLCEATGEISAGRDVTGAVLLKDRSGKPMAPGKRALDTAMRLIVEPIGPALDPCGVEMQGMPNRLELDAKATQLQAEAYEELVGSAPCVGAHFSFKLRVAGWYRVTVWVANKMLPLPHGCYPLLVRPLRPDPRMCRIEDPPDLSAPLPAGEPFGVLAVMRDTFGNVCTSGGFELRGTVRAPGEPIHEARAEAYDSGSLPSRSLVLCDRRDGSYEARFTPRAVGRHTLTLAMANGRHAALVGQAMQFDVVPGPPDPELCLAKGDGTRSATAGVPAQFVVEARDKVGNLIAEHGLELRVGLSPASRLNQLQVQACGDGRHVVRYQVPFSGIYQLSVLLGAGGAVRHVRGSPFEVPVHGGKGEDAWRTGMITPRPHSRGRSASPGR